MAIIGLQKGSGKRSRVREKSVKSQGILIWIMSGNPGVVVRPSTFSNIFYSETAWPIKAKFYVEPPWEGGTKVCINGPGHMTKMAAMPIYGKNLKKSSSPEPAGRFP